MRPSLATDWISSNGLLTEHKFCRKLSRSISIDIRYCDRFINLGRPIFPLNRSGALAATVFTTTFGIAHARCNTRIERATKFATRVGSSLLDSFTGSVNPLRTQNCMYLQSNLSCLYKLNCNIFNHHERLYFSLHRPAPAIRHFFFGWLIAGQWRQAAEPASWLRNDLSIPRAPENMSHKNIITIYFHIWT